MTVSALYIFTKLATDMKHCSWYVPRSITYSSQLILDDSDISFREGLASKTKHGAHQADAG